MWMKEDEILKYVFEGRTYKAPKILVAGLFCEVYVIKHNVFNLITIN